jgi:hypothetical protein
MTDRIYQANTGADESSSADRQPPAKANENIASDNPARPKDRIGPDRWIELFFTFAILAATVVNVCIANKQWSAMTESNKINRESFTSVQRAFIAISDVEVTPLYTSGEITHWALRVNVENSGNTPTVDLNVMPNNTFFPIGKQDGWNQPYLGIKLPEVPGDPEDIRVVLKRGGISLQALIGPHVKYPIASIGLPAAKGAPNGIEDVLAGHTRAFTYGAIHYHDIFEATREHVTKYCYGIGAEETKDGVRPRAYPCSHWNCADDECKQDKSAYEAEVTKAFRDAGQEVPREFYLPKEE